VQRRLGARPTRGRAPGAVHAPDRDAAAAAAWSAAPSAEQPIRPVLAGGCHVRHQRAVAQRVHGEAGRLHQPGGRGVGAQVQRDLVRGGGHGHHHRVREAAHDGAVQVAADHPLDLRVATQHGLQAGRPFEQPHAVHVRDAIRARGVRCETIVGDTPGAQRESIINDFKAGRIQCLTNANVLTTGFNAPGVDLLAMLRPTKSAGLYVQIVGRGCRLAPGKTDCLVLDFAGNIARHGPIDAVKPKRPKGGEDGVAPTKACPECDSIVHASVRTCPDCGHVFPPPELKIEAKASNLDILTSGKSEWVPVTRVSYARHDKPGKPPSLRVDYWSGLTHHSEWICIEHQGYPRQKAASWWANRAQGLPLPRRVDEAIACAPKLRCPSEIAVRPSGRYTEIVGARFP